MQSIRMLAVVTGTLVLASACGDGGGTPPPDNVAPVANFTAPSCTINVACTFTDASTDDVAVTTWSWDFNGDGTADATTEDAAYTYTAAGTFSVILTVGDAGGLTSTKTNVVTIAPAPPVNAPPVANFTAPSCTVNVACPFTDASTDDVAVTGWSWDFNGDGTADATTQNATFTYTTAGTFNARLTVTDGGTPALTDDVTQTVTVSPPAAQACTTTGAFVDCTLSITARANVKITLTGVSCELGGSGISIRPPVGPDHVFGNVCSRAVPESYTLVDVNGAPRVIEAGTPLIIRFTQGTATPSPGAPAGRLEGTFPNWTIRIDDGAAGPGEPDFNDAVLTVEAPAPL